MKFGLKIEIKIVAKLDEALYNSFYNFKIFFCKFSLVFLIFIGFFEDC